VVIIGSDLAFGAVAIYEIKRLFVSELAQDPMVNILLLLIDIGLASVLIALGIFMVWRLIDLFHKNGRWKKESDNPGLLDSQEVTQ